ncbi:MAG: hypothetical protein OWS03_07170 [Alicyclobacillaceae bacterium]|nr:hypothetical protein [Alicyclobacillaceae bacterium]
MAQFFYQFDGDLNFICTNYAIQVDEQTDFSVKLVQYCNQGGNPNITYALVNASTDEYFKHYPEVNGTYSSTADKIWFYGVPAGTWYLYIQNDGNGGCSSISLNGYVTSDSGNVVEFDGYCGRLNL